MKHFDQRTKNVGLPFVRCFKYFWQLQSVPWYKNMGIDTKTSLIWLKIIKLCLFWTFRPTCHKFAYFWFFGRHQFFWKRCQFCSEEHAASNKTCKYCIWNIIHFYRPPLLKTFSVTQSPRYVVIKTTNTIEIWRT